MLLLLLLLAPNAEDPPKTDIIFFGRIGRGGFAPLLLLILIDDEEVVVVPSSTPLVGETDDDIFNVFVLFKKSASEERGCGAVAVDEGEKESGFVGDNDDGFSCSFTTATFFCC